MATLPKQVRDQIAEAERISEEIEKAKAGEVTPVEEPAEEVDAPQDVTFDADQSVVEEHGFAEDDVEPSAEEPTGEVVETQPAPEDPNSDTFEQRWRTLQGKYNAEVRKTAELAGRVSTLEGMLAQLQERAIQQPEPQQQEPQVPETLVSQEEIDDYGSDLIDVMKRAAKEAVKDELDGLRAENDSLKAQIGGVGKKIELDDRTRLFARLDSELDGWRDTNVDPEFLGWLEQMDLYSGEPRKVLLNHAFENNDFDRVSTFFRGYLGEVAAVSRAAQPTEPQPQPKPNGKGKVPLESLVAPGVGHSGSADSTKDQGRIWKESDIGNFYADARKGAFRGREDEYRRIEQEIQQAMNEGRIVPGQ